MRNLENNKRNCTGRGVATTVAAATATSDVPPSSTTTTVAKPRSRLQFTLQQTYRALRGSVELITVNVEEAKRLYTLKKAIDIFKPARVKFQQEHRAYNLIPLL